MYRQDGFDDGHEYPVNAATHVGISVLMWTDDCPVCPDHLDWVTEEDPDSLKLIEGLD